MRKWISLLLAFALLLPMAPWVAARAEAAQADLESEIKQQVTAYTASLGTPNASGARNQLINHALFGKGKDLHMDASDAFTVALLNSQVTQGNLLESLPEAVRYMQSRDMDTLYLGGGMNWYDDRMSFNNYVYEEPPEMIKEETNQTKYVLKGRTTLSGWNFTPNACDAAMVDVVGSSDTWITLRRASATMDAITYQVDVKVVDEFDFDGAQTVGTLIGSWITGTVIDTYSWDTTFAFSFTVSNSCLHRSADYRWDFDVQDVLPDQAEGKDENPLTRIQTQKDDGTWYNPYYRMDHAVRLYHDRPWVVELRVKGGGALCLSPAKSFQENAPFLFKLGYRIQGGYPEKYMIYDEEAKQDEARYNRHLYGANFKGQGYSYADWLTYRIENRVAEDGTNMAYLLIDGTEIGPMIRYEQQLHDEENGATIYVETEDTGEWFNGVDFMLNYIGTNNYKLVPGTEIEFIQMWENGEGNDPYSYIETNHVAPTCDEPGKIIHICSLCGASYSEETGEAALGHAWGDGVVTTPATCTTDGVLTYTCANDPSHTRTEVIPATGHAPVTDAAVSATCTADGLTEGSHCETCGKVLAAQETVPALGHNWDEGSEVTKPTVNAPGTMMYTCTVCGETRDEEIPYESQVSRLAGGHRYETAFKAADQMKENLGIKKFDSVVVASGTNFADALSGSYLAAVKNAPILLACDVEWVNDLVKDYIYQNLNEDGTIYILGGEGAVPASFEEGLEDFEIERLAGGNRFETNLLVLEEAGVGDKPILVCTGLEFADSLSASATKLPILLVYGDKLLDDQTAFLEANQGRDLYIIGGEGAVSEKLESALTAYGNIERVAGNNRFETSTLIAETFFEKPESAVLAYAWDFPDGLCGGPLATTMNAPLLLTMANYEAKAAEYIQTNAISNAIILGGETLIPDPSVNILFP